MAFLFMIVFCAGMAWAAITDFCTFRIFNYLIVILTIAFLAFCAVGDLSWTDFFWHWVAALAVFGLFLVFYVIGQMGAGDVKLAAIVALWFGWHPITITYILYALIAGGVLTLLLYLWRFTPLPAGLAGSRTIRRLHIRNKIPYGITLGGTAIWLAPSAPIFQM